MTANMETAIYEHIAGLMSVDLEALFKKRDKEKKEAGNPLDLSEIQTKYASQEQEIRKKFSPGNWLSDVTKKMKKLRVGTHILQFANGSIDKEIQNVIFLDKENHPLYLDTSCLTDIKLDVSGNAAYAKAREFLLLESKEGVLAELLLQGKTDFLKIYASSEDEYSGWCHALLKTVDNASPASHTLTKQVYFPTNNGAYHLLSPLYSSSLSQVIYDKIQFTKFSQESKEVRKAKKNNKYSQFPEVRYPNIAVTISGGSQPQNISQKNSGRGGRTYLLPNSPPKWESQITPPVYLKNFFSLRELNWQTNRTVKQLAVFLEKVVDLDSNQKIRNYRNRLVNEIIDTVFNLSLTMTQLPTGWTEQAKLPYHQKVWLDPHLPEHQGSNDWSRPVAGDFAQWLNKRLNKTSSEKLLFAKTESVFWQDAFIQGIEETKFGRRR